VDMNRNQIEAAALRLKAPLAKGLCC